MLAATFAIGGAVGALAGPRWGFALIGVGLLLVLQRHLSNLTRLLRWAHDPGQPVPEGSGAWGEAFDALHRHVRATREDRERLASALVRFRNAALAMPDGVVVLDAELRIEWCNPIAERQLGIAFAQDAGQPIANLLRQPDFVAYVERGRFEEPLSLRITRGEALVLSMRIVPFGQDQKLLLARDVTQAERVETMRRDFVANVSHELKTPLTVVSGYIETLADGKLQPGDPRLVAAFSTMQIQTRRMAQLIEDLLELSALESSPRPGDEGEIDMRRLLRTLLSEAEALSGGRHRIRLEFGGPDRVTGSERELASAFGNILSNAVRYTPEGGEVRVTWRSQAGGAAFVVEDTGPGIESRHIPRLTERFYRVDSGRSRVTGGTGLGLAIVKHVLTRHQADLEIESEIGRGSRFTVTLPPARVHAPAASHEPDERTLEDALRS